MMVTKKDGRKAKFDREKLNASILNAFESVDGEVTDYAKTKAENIVDYIEKEKLAPGITSDEIGNLVENGLMSCKRKDVAKAYVLKRDERTRMRGNTTDKTINEIVNGTSAYWTTENSNKNAALASTQRDYMAGAISEDISRRQLLPTDIVEAHDAGEIHFHDIDYFAQRIFNCDVYNLEDMLQNGTVINKTLIEKPHSFSTACNIATQIMAVIASGQYGGQTISLSHLAPFIDVSRQKIKQEVEEELKIASSYLSDETKDKIVEKRLAEEITRGVQTMQYQINTLNTSNGQTPFVSLFMYLNEAKNQREKDDLAMFIAEVLRQRIQGVKDESGSYVTPAFPKLLYVLENDNVEKDSEYYWLTELAAECTAKRLVPDYISEKIMLELKGDCYPCMGCRSFLTPDRWSNKLGNIANSNTFDEHKGHVYYGRFNQGVVTVNLPYVALEAYEKSEQDGREPEEVFWEEMERVTELCHRALQCRHNRLMGTKSDISPIHWQYGGLARLKPGETIDKLLFGGYSTISLGYAGLWECVKVVNNKKLTEPEGEELGLKVMQFLNDKCAQWKAAEDIDYSLYGTPLESTTYKFAKALKKRFGEIEGVSDRDYITNSYHIHVTEPVDAFTKLATEAKFQKLSPGGAISYVETPNLQNNIPAVLDIMTFIYNNIMYAELNTKSDHCQVCGYDGEIKLVDDGSGHFDWECPKCGNRDHTKMHVARRTCGYIGSNFWNYGRTMEIKDRVLHIDND